MLLFIRSKSRDSMIYFRSNTTILFGNTMPLFINTTGGMKNLPVVFFIPMLGIKIMILVLLDKLLVFFDISIGILRAHARIHKVFTLATVATLQHYLRISVLRVATRWQGWQRMAILPLIFIQHSYYVYQTTACGLRSPGLRGSKVPPPWVEARGSVGRRYGLHDPWGLSLRVLGISPLPPKECFASPIGDIGVPP